MKKDSVNSDSPAEAEGLGLGVPICSPFVDVTDSERARDGSQELRYIRTVTGNLWISALYRLTGFGYYEWETAICTREPQTCNIVRGDRRHELENLEPSEIAEWLNEHGHEKNSMETVLGILSENAEATHGGTPLSLPPCSLSSFVASAKFCLYGVFLAAVCKFINLYHSFCESSAANQSESSRESVYVEIKPRWLNLKVLNEVKTRDRKAALSEKSKYVDLVIAQIGWLKLLRQNISLRIRIFATRLLCLQARFQISKSLISRRKLLREIRIMRAKVALLPKPSEASTNLPVMCADPPPHENNRSTNGRAHKFPVIVDPIYHEAISSDSSTNASLSHGEGEKRS